MSPLPTRPVETAAQTHLAAQLFGRVPEKFHANAARLEGVIAKLWTYDGDVYARLAVYDRHTVVEAPAETTPPRRKAHYVSLWLVEGKTLEGVPLTLQKNDKVLVTGHLCDRTYSESLAALLKRTQQASRLQPGDDTLFVGRNATYLKVETLIRLA